jgi:hypothetical protein
MKMATEGTPTSSLPFLNCEIREFGINVPAQTMHRFWRMVANWM